MKILAFESSAKSASVALLHDEKILAHNYQNIGFTHSKTLLPLCEDMLKSIEMSVADVDIISVAHGPGSYTGVRIGISVAQGLAVALDKKCVGVSTLEALAYNLAGLTDKIICVVMDARVNQVYNALFAFENGVLQRLCSDRAISTDELLTELKNLKKSYILVGDGAKMCYNIFTGIDISVAPEHLLYGNACSVAKASLNHTPILVDDLIPKYLRLSQAEREKKSRTENI